MGYLMEDLSNVGAGAAISILTVLYGFILKYFLFDPIAIRLEDRASNSELKLEC